MAATSTSTLPGGTAAGEDFLERILELIDTRGYARAVEGAEHPISPETLHALRRLTSFLSGQPEIPNEMLAHQPTLL